MSQVLRNLFCAVADIFWFHTRGTDEKGNTIPGDNSREFTAYASKRRTDKGIVEGPEINNTIDKLLKSGGWDPALGTVCGTELSKDDLVLATKMRNEEWIALKDAVRTRGPNVQPLYDLQAFELLFTTGTDKKKLLLPKFRANMCFRRGYCIPKVVSKVISGMATPPADLGSARTLIVNDVQFPTFDNIAFAVMKYDDEMDRIAHQVGENEGKMEGAKKYTDRELFVTARKLIKGGVNQTRLRSAYRDGTGQKLWEVFTSDAKYPSLHLDRRIMEGFALQQDQFVEKIDYQPGGPVTYGPLSKEELRKINGGVKGDIKDSEKYGGRTPEALERYIGDAMKGKADGNADKILDGATVRQMALQNRSCGVVGLALDAIVTKNTQPLIDHLNNHGDPNVVIDVYNRVKTLIESGFCVETDTVLAQLWEELHPQASEPKAPKAASKKDHKVRV